MLIPSDYVEGYEQAKLCDPELADTYVSHLLIGDPAADEVVKDLASVSQEYSARFINASLDSSRRCGLIMSHNSC